MSTTAPSACFVGIDVAKDHLDVHLHPQGTAWRCANDDAGITDLIARLRTAVGTPRRRDRCWRTSKPGNCSRPRSARPRWDRNC